MVCIDEDYNIDNFVTKAAFNYEDVDETPEIRMVTWDDNGATIERRVIESCLKGFNIRYPNITVKLEIMQSYETTFPTVVASGKNVPDVFLMPDGSFPSWATMNACFNLDPLIESSELVDMDKMYASSCNRYRYNAKTGMPSNEGTQLALPKDIGPMAMYYNKKIFDDAGVDYPSATKQMTITEATAMWKSLCKQNSKGQYTRYGVSGLGIEGLVWSAGGDFLNPDRTSFPTETSTINGLKKAYQFMQDAYVKDYITPPNSWTVGAKAEDLFAQQKVACFIGLKAYVANFRQLSFDWDIAPIPGFEEAPELNAWSGSVGYSIYNKSENIEAAWKLVEYIASKEGQEILSATGFQIPVYPELSNDPEFLAREKESLPHNFEVFLEGAEHQPAGTWQYRSNNLWKTQGYDATSEALFHDDPAKRITVDTFLDEVKNKLKGLL